ncbi:Hsp20/alpha crystallin family protein [Frankia sp. CNm7]|uniref:Hsp20/alpha crystallin family protein n=1 Tax=Frankia nepalensis TaxID=1836974 RepID=A0A937R655_9ACTN|nr:Hsp20/alpha crystallin family protein [Frankia nepalensis]MBL7502828.1 Hsp20/alpha crystallin family protein [Frankia nepalensis]MBL7515096.1 Hsp20/alpha crystallin family protein [Frankia nepalensis]MBL7518823.1 Hsp20/alpha crystallin family protein [Frankia nepalensis]MBL7625956.1 Hsp20/alpha crystallin family protein [Frankia nepalensis]
MALPTRGDRPMLARWDPFREIEDAWSKMGSLLGDVVSGGAPEGRTFGTLTSMVTPVDVEETDDAFVVELDLPGVAREDVMIDLRDNELVVSGEIRERERTGKLRRQTRRVGRFEHRVTLPGEVDPDSVRATLRDGVLTLQCAKRQVSHPKRIEIEP